MSTTIDLPSKPLGVWPSSIPFPGESLYVRLHEPFIFCAITTFISSKSAFCAVSDQ